MKTTSESLTLELSRDELMNISGGGGNELSETLAWTFGWIVGGAVAIWESTIRYQMELDKQGIHVNHF